MSDEEEPEEYYYDEGEDDGGEDEEHFYTNGSTGDMGMDAVVFQAKPEALDHMAIMEKMRKDVDEVASVLAWPAGKALLLLRHFKWSKDRAKETFFDDPERCATLAGVNVDSETSMLVFGEAGGEEIECAMCWSDVDPTKAAHLGSCTAHWFCLTCWHSNLKFRMDTEGVKCVGAPCLMKKCTRKCSEAVFQQVFPVGDPYRKKYERYLLTDYILSNDKFCGCPQPGCEYTIFSPQGKVTTVPSQAVKCECKREFCFLCQDEVHSPCNCKTLVSWLKKEQDESETANWFVANTKLCPNEKCRKAVEKNGGCNHMHCQQCGHDWCWVCEGLWSTHGSSYYKCNYFKPEDAKKGGKEDEAKKARDELQKYIHYYTRYRNHDQSKKMDETVLINTRRRIEQELKSTQRSLSEVDYLEDTALTLISCRHMLKYSYVYAFYMENGSPKDLFEYNQSQLEFATELLSEFVEDRSGRYSKLDVVNRTSTARQMLKNMSDQKY